MDIASGLDPGKSSWANPIVIALMAIVTGLAAGELVVTIGPLKSFGLLSAAVAGLLVLRSAWFAYGLVLFVVFLVPFSVVPLSDSPLTPTVFELTVLVTLATVGGLLLVDRRIYLRLTGEEALWVGLLGIIGFAFLLGLGRGYSTETLHNFFKFVLALFVFPLTIQMIRSTNDARLVVRLVIILSGVASALALILYAGGANFSERVLAKLVPYGYPSFRIVRYIEDDPAKAMRAVGTSVDPNALGGLLMVGFVLAGGQLLVKNRALPLILALIVAGSTGLALLLTYSRGAWVGATAGVVIILLLRRPLWLFFAALLSTAALLLGAGGGFTERLWLGFTLQDPATRLRLAEYRNAWAIIKEHPWFGVGFGEAPSLELQTGVSSIYLTAAEQAGLIGLASFLIIAGVIVWRTSIDLLRFDSGPSGDLLLMVGAAFVSVLTVGLVDHYYFNATFPHMVATFWLLAGTLVAIYSIRRHSRDEETEI